MTLDPIQQIVIVGGGTAGWMTAAALAHVLDTQNTRITLIESDDIGTVGVGEATIPLIQKFNQMLGVNENDFLKFSSGTYKLGIEFVDWGSIGNRYIHPFGPYGMPMGMLNFHHYWLRHFSQNASADPGDFSVCIQAAYAGKFMPAAQLQNSPLSQISHAYHFDASRYALYLREFAEQRGVKRIEGKVTKVNVSDTSGFIDSIEMENLHTVVADFFVDCSGFRGLLIEEALNTGYESYSHYLPCDRAVVVQTKNVDTPRPYTRATAHTAGWQWNIPLQHRTGNGCVYSSKFMDDDSAKDTLFKNLEGEAIGDSRILHFTPGLRRKFWNKNCVAIGLSSGFIEPLESTSIHLIQVAISKLIALFPTKQFAEKDTQKYNQLMEDEFTSIRDFIILHYKLTQRVDSDFWNYCRNMDIPKNLEEKILHYQQSGRMIRDNNELFDEVSWFAVMHGQGLRSNAYHPLANEINDKEFARMMQEISAVIQRSVEAMPNHDEYIRQHCSSKK